MSKGTKHYAKAHEKFVKSTILYMSQDRNSGKAYLYYDKDYNAPVYKDELEDLFLDGVVIRANKIGTPEQYAYLKPTKYTVGEGTLNVSGGDSIDVYTISAFDRPVDESDRNYYLESISLDGFKYEITTKGVPIYRNKNRDFKELITIKSSLVLGETYTVNWDGVEYNTELKLDEGGYYLGQNYYYPSPDEPCPFGLLFDLGWNAELNAYIIDTILTVIATTPETSHTVSIYK